MIEVTLEELVMTVMVLTILTLAVLISGDKFATRYRRKALRKGLVRCRACGHSWENEDREKFPICPACGRKNQRGRDRRLG